MSDSPASGFSVNGLLEMHLAVVNALKADDETPDGQEKVYGVRNDKDWRQ